MNNHLVARPALRTPLRALILTAVASLLTLGAGNAALAAGGGHGGGGGGGGRGGGGFGGGAHVGFGGHAGFGAPGRGFAGGRFGPGYGRGYGWRGYGWGPGWGWGLGWYLPVLPLYYSTYWWDGVPYYYSGDYYYEWNPTVGEYEAVVPPSGVAQQPGAPAGAAVGPAGQPPAEAAELFAYPKNGQSPEQQAKDRGECRSWARAQVAPGGANGAADVGSGGPSAAPVAAPPGSSATAVGALQQAAAGTAPAPAVDPPGTAPAAGPPPGEPTGAGGFSDAAQRSGYLRAEAACLEGRGYSVQ